MAKKVERESSEIQEEPKSDNDEGNKTDSEAQEKKLRLVRLRRGKDLLRAALRVGSGRGA